MRNFKTIPLFDVSSQQFSSDGYDPPIHVALRFKTIQGETFVGFTGQLSIPIPNEQGETLVNSKTVFLALDRNWAVSKVFLPNEVASWDDTGCEWASASMVRKLYDMEEPK